MDQTTPPPLRPPPPLGTLYPPPSPRARRGRGWLWLLLILGGGSFCAFVAYSFVKSALGGSLGGRARLVARDHLHEVVVEERGSENKIAVIDVDGIITSQAWDRSGRNMVDAIEDQLELADEDDAVKAVILRVDSPGGEVLASDDIARAVADFQERTAKPVVAAMGGLAASGGYYVSAPCRWIVANELTITGSIGVIMQSFNYRGLMDKVGLRAETFKSGRFKDMLSGTKAPEEVDPAERAMIQDMVNETYKKFAEVVRTGRKRAETENSGEGRVLSGDWQNYADGRVLTGKQAFDLGFVDELGNLDTAIRRARKLADITNADVIRYEEPMDFSRFFSLFGQAESRTIKIDLGLESPKIQAGRPYFLAPTLLH